MANVRIGKVLGIFATVLLASEAFADSQARIVRLSDVQGNVQIDRRTGEGFESALQNLPVTQGTRISTRDDGRVEIEFEDGSTVRLAPNSSIEFTRLSLRDSGAKNTELDLSEGTAYFNIDLGKRDDFVVDLGHRSINLERSARFRVTMDPSQAHVAVSRGQVEMQAQGSDAITIDKNRTASFDLSNQDVYSVDRGYDEGPYEDWNDDLDAYHQKNSVQTSSDSPYAYGFSDLNYYGSYISDPGFGSCWRPYFASFGWDPFADGTWVWYPGFGYTWVSSYPWGWAPYRYGSWNYLQSNGWCWQPGNWNQWAVVPRFINRPSGYHPPAPPANGHGRVPRIRENPVASGVTPRVGTPMPRGVRVPATGEAGLGVPRGHTNLGRLSAPPEPGSRGFNNLERGNSSRQSSSQQGSGNPNSGSAAGRSSGPRSAPSSAPPAPRMEPPAPRPAPAPRGGGNKG